MDPGLRFTVFMQGCPLKCKFCHNRDTWDLNLGKDMTPEELIREVVKYKSYYRYSNGGLTISGGEPFYQPAFLLELLREDITEKRYTTKFLKSIASKYFWLVSTLSPTRSI